MSGGADLRVRVVSDLHMFCRRSRWEDFLPELDAAAAGADLFIFNGDTVDFKWTELGGAAQTAMAGAAFLEDFATRHPHCRVHVNLGNHDHHRLFMAALDVLAQRHAHFSWEPYLFRFGNAVFLHGDAAHFGARVARLERYRAGWLDRPPASARINRLHDWGFHVRIQHVLPALVFPQARILGRLSAYLEAVGCGAAAGVDTVCYGHAHRPMHGALFREQRYYNSGAAMRGLPWRVLEFTLRE